MIESHQKDILSFAKELLDNPYLSKPMTVIEDPPYIKASSKKFQKQVKRELKIPGRVDLNLYPDRGFEDNIPVPEDIKFKKIDDQTKLRISNMQHNKQIDDLIECFRHFSTDSCNYKRFIPQLCSKLQLVFKYKEQKNPKAWVLYFIATKLDIIPHKISSKQLLDIDSKNYPLLDLIKSWQLNQENNFQQGYKYHNRTVQFGQPLALYEQAIQLQDYLMAYSYFKKAQEKIEPSGNALLAMARIFRKGQSTKLKMNPNLSLHYFQRAIKKGAKFSDDDKTWYREMQHFKKTKTIKFGQCSIINTKSLQAESIAAHLVNKLWELEQTNLQNIHLSHSSCTKQSHLFTCSLKKVTIVFGSNKMLASKNFIGIDEDGDYHSIYVYKWNCLPVAKLQLLHTLGTKVYLHHYISKLSSFDSLPMIRIENPNWIEIQPGPIRKNIPDTVLNQFVDILLEKNMLKLSLLTAVFIAFRQDFIQRSSIFIKIGMIFLVWKKNDLAEKSFQASCKVCSNIPSLLKLFDLNIEMDKMGECKTIIQQVQKLNPDVAIELKQRLQEQTKKISDYNLKKYFIRKLRKYKIEYKKFNNLNTSGKQNFLHFQAFFLQHKHIFLNIEYSRKSQQEMPTDKQFLSRIKYSFELPDTSNLNNISGKEINAFFALCNTVREFQYILMHGYFDIIVVFKQKKQYFRKRVFDYCDSLQVNGQYQRALSIFEGTKMDDIFWLRAIDTHIFLGHFKQALTICNNKIKECKYKQNIAFYENQKLRVLLKLKHKIQFDYFLRVIQIDQQNGFFNSAVQALLLLSQVAIQIKDYKLGLQLINRSLHIRKLHKQVIDDQFYCQLLVFKVKILGLDGKYQQVKQLSSKIQQIFEKANNLPNKNLYLKEIERETIRALLFDGQYNQFISCAKKIIDRYQNNILFINSLLLLFISKRKSVCKQLLEKIRKSKKLSALYQSLYTKCRNLFRQSSQNDQELISYLKLDEIGSKSSEEQSQQQLQLQKDQFKYSIDKTSQHLLQHENVQEQDEYERLQDFICRIHWRTLELIVLIDSKLQLEKNDKIKFIIATQKVSTGRNTNGIKFMKDGSLRLKIKGNARLLGRQERKGNQLICFFYKRQRHDDYKR